MIIVLYVGDRDPKYNRESDLGKPAARLSSRSASGRVTSTLLDNGRSALRFIYVIQYSREGISGNGLRILQVIVTGI